MPRPLQTRQSNPKMSCPPSAVMVQCDRALVRNARGVNGGAPKKTARRQSHLFFVLARASAPKPHAHFAVAVLGGQRLLLCKTVARQD